MSQDQNQTQGISPLTFFPPFPPFPVIPLYQPGSNNDTINVGGSIISGGNPSPVTVTDVTTAEYTATAKDYFLCVDTDSNPVAITLPAGILGTVYVVKDCTGNANTNNITVAGTGGELIDGSTAEINTSYGSVTVIFNGSEWSIV